MKKIFLTLTLLLFVLNVFSQAETKPNIRDHYLKKGKDQKRIANILLVGGAASVLTGIVIPKGEEIRDFSFLTKYKNDGIRGTFLMYGLVSMLLSIPFYIVSAKNKRKANAATISFNNERVLFQQRGTFITKTQPTLTLRIGL